jgi:hypothetical protein
LGLWPETVPLDPDDGADSPALDAIIRGPAAALTAVVLLAGEQARASGWAARAAVALARRWPGPRHTVLVDLDVERPSLHQLTGVENETGVIDVVELGASLHRIAVPVENERFHVLPAGAFGGDGDVALLQSEAWPAILYDAAARRETLLLYVPAESRGTAALVQRVGTVVVLAAAAETKTMLEGLPRRYAVLVVVEQPFSETAAAAAAPAAAGAAPYESAHIRVLGSPAERAALIAGLRTRQRAARLTRRAVAAAAAAKPRPEPRPTPVAVAIPSGTGDVAREVRLETAADAVALETIAPPPPPPPRRRLTAQPISWTLFVVFVISLVAGSLHFLAGRLRRPAQAPPQPADSAAAPPVTPPPLPPDAVAYSVALEAHQSVATALERVDDLAAAQSDLSFYVAPLERDGVLHYHVMAGPVVDSTAALALRDTLRVRRIKTTSTPTDIRYTPLALLIGDYSARADAEEQIGELRRLDIPAYLVVGLAADSVPLYRVFVGGFAGPAEADVARQLLRAAGVRDQLVNRTRSSIR